MCNNRRNIRRHRWAVPEEYIESLPLYDESVAYDVAYNALRRMQNNERSSGIPAPDYVVAVPAGSEPVPGCARAGRQSITPDGYHQSFDVYYRYINVRPGPSRGFREINQEVEESFSDTSNPREARERCNLNWVEVGAIDQTTGDALSHLPYRVISPNSGVIIASGILDENGLSERHEIDTSEYSLIAIFGTDEAVQISQDRIVEEQLKANAVDEWHGFRAGLSETEFNEAYDHRHWRDQSEEPLNAQTVDSSRAFINEWLDMLDSLDSLTYGHPIIVDPTYYRTRRRAFHEYQIATGAHRPTEQESYEAGIDPGLFFAYDSEIASFLSSWHDSRDYDQALRERDQLARQYQISHGYYYVAGELTGMIPTMLIPVGGELNAARGASITTRAYRAGRTSALLGGISGGGHDEGGIVDRLDGIFLGAVTAGIGGALLQGAGILIARGIARSRIWGRVQDVIRRSGRYRQSRSTNIEYENWGGEFADDAIRRTSTDPVRGPLNTAQRRLGTTRARHLSDELIIDAVARNPEAGRVIISSAHLNRLPFSGFDKMSQRIPRSRVRRTVGQNTQVVDTDFVEVHYLYNRITGEIADLKIILTGRR